MARNFNVDRRILLSGAILAAGMIGLVGATELGDVDLGAGGMKIMLAKRETGMLVDIAPRTCPPKCGIDLNWRLRGL